MEVIAVDDTGVTGTLTARKEVILAAGKHHLSLHDACYRKAGKRNVQRGRAQERIPRAWVRTSDFQLQAL